MPAGSSPDTIEIVWIMGASLSNLHDIFLALVGWHQLHQSFDSLFRRRVSSQRGDLWGLVAREHDFSHPALRLHPFKFGQGRC